MPVCSRTVVAVFDDYPTAERAVNDLVSNGFSRETIEITSNYNFASDSAIGNTGLSGREPRDRSGGGMGGFFRRLFGDDEYADHYDEAIRRGGVVVSVMTDDEDRAVEILDHNGAIDVAERAAAWRQEGYGTGSNLSSDRDVIRDRTETTDHSIPVVREEPARRKTRRSPRRGARV